MREDSLKRHTEVGSERGWLRTTQMKRLQAKTVANNAKKVITHASCFKGPDEGVRKVQGQDERSGACR